MAKSNIRYFVELEPGNHNYHAYIKSKTHCTTRSEFAFKNCENNMIRVHGTVFNVSQVHAEPRKKTALLEIAITCAILFLLFKFYAPYHGVEITPFRWIFGEAMAALFGFLVGRLRIDKQKCQAEHFNKSRV